MMSATLLSNSLSVTAFRICKVFLISFCLFLTVDIIIYSLPVFKDSKLSNLFSRHNTVGFKFFYKFFCLQIQEPLAQKVMDPDPD
jgi:hypothetical protein